MMRTTLDLPDALFKKVKTRAVQQGVTLKDLFATYIEAGLRGSLDQPARAIPPENPYPLPVAFERVPGAPPTPYRTNAELFAMLEEEDLAGHRRVIEESQRKS